MVYDRYAGMVSLPGPDGKERRPFRVDEDWNVIYLDEERDASQSEGLKNVGQPNGAGILSWGELDRKRDSELEEIRRLGADMPIQLAEAPNPNWNGRDVMYEQGQRDGGRLKPVKDHLFPSANPNAPLPPAARTYPVPAGSTAWPGDPQHRFIRDKDGKLVQHPAYKQAFEGDLIDKKGVVKDLGTIALGTAWALKGGQMALRTAQAMVGTSAAKQGYELAKKFKAQKEPR